MLKIKHNNRKARKAYHKLLKSHNMYLREREILKREALNFPEGDIRIKSVGSHYGCYKTDRSTETSVKKSAKETLLMARKIQATSDLRDIEFCIDLSKSALSKMETYLNSQERKRGAPTLKYLPEVFDCEIFALTRDERAFLKRFPATDSWHTEGLIYPTKCGIKVRSKSEKIIADALYDNGILFRYEPKLKIGNHYFYPDFVIFLDTDRIIIWEHFGLLNDNDYKEKTLWKLGEYSKNGYKQHTNLICTTESDIVSKDTLQTIIDERLL